MELLGWIATAVVLVSFLFDGIWMRMINGLGAFLWMLWAIGMGQSSVIFLNAVIVLIHVGKLTINRKKEGN